jgi:hypothetical protein
MNYFLSDVSVLKLQIMSVHSIEISTENLLGVVVQMPDAEFDKFIEKARKLRQKKVKSAWTKYEIGLIKKINESILSDQEQNRFDELVKKRRAEKISQDELNELIALSEKSEAINVERVKMLIALAESKKVTLDEIMDKLGIKPPQTL